MQTLVLNSGSSSIKFSRYVTGGDVPERVLDGEVSGVGTGEARLDISGKKAVGVTAGSRVDAVGVVFGAVEGPVDAVGYRVVHPGARLQNHARIDEEVLRELEGAAVFAPLHDPEAVEVIREGMKRFPEAGHYACFDTVFHRTMPKVATVYPVPEEVRAQGVRRFGFHGLSCESVVWQMRRAVGVVFPRSMVIAHLGGGSSVTAVVDGVSVDTSMGLTPTGGVLMGTRPGDLDPGLVFYLLRQEGATVDSVEKMLNHGSGMKGLCGMSDMQSIEAGSGRETRLALEVFWRSLRRAIGGMAAVHGVGAVVFTGGIGEHDARTRMMVANGLWGEEPSIARVANEAKVGGVRKISEEDGNVPVYVVPAMEDLMIAMHVERMAQV